MFIIEMIKNVLDACAPISAKPGSPVLIAKDDGSIDAGLCIDYSNAPKPIDGLNPYAVK